MSSFGQRAFKKLDLTFGHVKQNHQLKFKMGVENGVLPEFEIQAAQKN
jgi:hypothetical protein